MPRRSQTVDDIDAILEAARQPRFIRIVRKIYPHRRSNNGAICLCGCGSRVAYAYDERDHIDLLVDRETGGRRLRSDVVDKAGWDRLADDALVLDLPLRAHDRQLELILDKRHKIVAAFGGERGGKTSFLKEWIADFVLLHGGPGSQFWWVAPRRDKTQIGVDMLARGYKPARDRFVAPVFPRDFVVSFPGTETQTDQAIRLLDGTSIPLKHAGREGGNLKGVAPLGIAVDEGCEIQHKSNWDTILGRTMDSGGKVAFASTPVLGSWAKETIADVGKTADEAIELEAQGKLVHTIAEQLTCEDNPWLSPKDVAETICAKAGTSDIEEAKRDPAVRREVFGEWVGEGDLLWRHFRPTPDPETGICHLREGPARDCSFWGLVNVTRLAYGGIFRDKGRLDQVAGVDINVYPSHANILQIAVPRDMDQSDRANWICVVLDEVIKVGTVWEFGKHIAEKAARQRGLAPDAYANMSMIVDGTAGQKNPPKEQGPFNKAAATPHRILEQLGFQVQPPMWHRPDGSKKKSPANPGRKDAVSTMHLLMRETVKATDGTVWPKLIIRADTCPTLADVLGTQEGDEGGLPIKRSHNKSDRDCGSVEALWYAVWPVFGRQILRKKEVNIQW